MTGTNENPERPPLIGGPTILAAIVLGVAVWLYFGPTTAVSSAGTVGAPAPATAPESARFRSDAWFLPDEPLLGFVEIPGGPIVMGSDPAVDSMAFDNERWSGTSAQGTVDVPTFYISRYEVTVAQFRAFAEAAGYDVDEQSLAAPAEHPVTQVTWPDALAYARWLEDSLREWPGTPPELRALLDDGWRISLPSEAEWEKAARGTDGRIYPWGNVPRRDRANFQAPATVPVGSVDCPECAYGLRDMSGNVWEWTRSPYQPYPFETADDATDLESDALFVMRGGAFGDGAQLVRAAARGGGDPGVRRPFIGFRLVFSRF